MGDFETYDAGKVEGGSDPDMNLVQITTSYIQEARNAKTMRMIMNRINFDAYHLRQDFSHKRKGQSKEFMAKQPMAVEQISTFMQEGLVDTGDWFGVEPNNGVDTDDLPITANEVQLIIGWGLDKCKFLPFVGDQVKMALLQSLAVSKIHGKYANKAIFYTESKEEGGKFVDKLKRAEKKVWVPLVESLRAEDWYPDPTGKNLYFIQETYMDIHELYQLSEGPHKIYDRAVVEMCHGSYLEADTQAARKSRETGQNTAMNSYRKKVKIHECWGSILEQGSGKLLAEKQMWTIADDRYVIMKPKDYPFWHGDIPILSTPFIRVPHSVWHKALMDAPTQTNIAINELYNLMVDGGMSEAHGIKQVRTDWMEDTSQISNGIYPGIAIKVGTNCPPGQKVIERVDTGSLSPETFNVFQQMMQEFNTSALTNDLRMGGAPQKDVKATAIVEASQSITSVFTGLAKVIEVEFICPILTMMWKNILQHFSEIDEAELADVLGKDRVKAILKLSKEELFAKCCTGYKFKVFGISRILAKQKDFRKITGLLQTIAGSPQLMEEFMKKYSMGGMLTEIIDALDINTDKLKISKEEQAAIMQSQQAQGQGGGAPGGATQSNGPNQQSQIPQATAQGGDQQNSPENGEFATLMGKALGGQNHSR